MDFRTVGTTDFPNTTPIKAVEHVMKQCSGAIILGFPQIVVKKGISKPKTPQEKNIKNKLLPTPWNHIESTMAFMLDLPILVLKDKGVEGGIFDIGTTEQFIHIFNLNNQNWADEIRFLQPFNDWHNEVLKK